MTEENMLFSSSEVEELIKPCCADTVKVTMEQITNFSHLYKKNINLYGTVVRQEARRKEILEEVKMRRNMSIDEKRAISDIFVEEPMEIGQKKHSRRNLYANKIMLSEYFLDVPDDLEYNWTFKFCPVGSRCLVVAHNRKTVSYNKLGYNQAEFESLLPGGGPNNRGSAFTILDCIYNPKTEVFHVLDLIAWNSYSLRNCSTEFRFFFLKSKLDENPELKIISKHNKYKFSEIPSHPAHITILESVFAEPLDCLQDESLDGILFYHKEVDYRENMTPLVGWLKPFMVSEILRIPVHGYFMKDKPHNYENIKSYIQNSQMILKKKAHRKKKLVDVEMTSTDDTELPELRNVISDCNMEQDDPIDLD